MQQQLPNTADVEAATTHLTQSRHVALSALQLV
jgi:hypothetical protein